MHLVPAREAASKSRAAAAGNAGAEQLAALLGSTDISQAGRRRHVTRGGECVHRTYISGVMQGQRGSARCISTSLAPRYRQRCPGSGWCSTLGHAEWRAC